MDTITSIVSLIESTVPHAPARRTIVLALQSGQLEAAWSAFHALQRMTLAGEVQVAHYAEDAGYALLRAADRLLAVDDVAPGEHSEDTSDHDESIVTLARQESRDGAPCDALWTIKAARSPLLRAAVRTELLALHGWGVCPCCDASGSVGDWHDAQECPCCTGCGYAPDHD